ncbi:MAG: GGDEF domain-containing protein [Gammaproteobacteria bacterium]|nr:GGDEF domain-containing protein [Gammaproteobacteria bacterium]
MKIFPSLYFFDRDTEALFKQRLYEKTAKSSVPMATLLSIVLMTFTLSEIDNWTPQVELINILRLLIILVTFIGLFFVSRAPTKNKLNVWRITCATDIALIMAVFYLSGLEYNSLSEGGPLLVIFAILLVPTLSLVDKIVCWTALWLFLVWFQLNSTIEMDWTPLYFFLGTCLAIAIQRQLDLLLRHQFRSELIEAEKASTDRLTGTFNRHGLNGYVTAQMSSLKAGEFLHIAMVDLDQFKRYNDTYGHLEGDLVLTKVAKTLLSLKPDRVVRFGGEEFILIERNKSQRPEWLENVNSEIALLNIQHESSTVAGHVTVSAGVVTIGKNNINNASTKSLLAAADELLYQVKNTGRNNWLHRIL